jgi:hypothetical protein
MSTKHLMLKSGRKEGQWEFFSMVDVWRENLSPQTHGHKNLPR